MKGFVFFLWLASEGALGFEGFLLSLSLSLCAVVMLGFFCEGGFNLFLFQRGDWILRLP